MSDFFSAFFDELHKLAQEDEALDAKVKGKSPAVKRPLQRRTSIEEEKEEGSQSPAA